MDKKLLAPAVVQYPFPERMAEELVRMLENDEKIDWNKSLVSTHGYESEVRTSSQFNFEHEMPIASSKLKPIFIDAVNDYIQTYNVNVTQDEGLTLLRYSEFNKYDYHVDADWTIYRVVSALIYLNPQDYEGGETHFKLMDFSVKPEKPSIVLFPSNYAYLHAAMPVTSGTKYVLVTWMNDLPNGIHQNVIQSIAHATGRY